jgi:hypothetical protein
MAVIVLLLPAAAVQDKNLVGAVMQRVVNPGEKITLRPMVDAQNPTGILRSPYVTLTIIFDTLMNMIYQTTMMITGMTG